MNTDEVKAHFREETTVRHYTQLASDIGLWRSEEIVFKRTFKPGDAILDLGCGAGRIAFGLWELGYRRVLGIDFTREMVASARMLAAKLEYEVPFRVGDATKLAFDAGTFDGAIFGFNGLMQIPDHELRRQALREIRKVVRAGGHLVFTTPEGGAQAPFVHLPERAEVLTDLEETGWRRVDDAARSEIAHEPADVTQISGECRFWIASASGPGGGVPVTEAAKAVR